MNPIQWVEIATRDIERAKKFYEMVFQIEFQYMKMPDSEMYMFGDPTGVGSSGCLVHSPDTRPSAEGSLVYFGCEDVASELSRVEEAGGEIVIPKSDIGEFGFFAHIMDTEGNKIGIHSQK